jgi:phosphoribosylanthranilate isomerase
VTRVKVCGVRTPEDLHLVADAGADAVGVISGVPVDTHREVNSETAADLVAAGPPFLTTTLVTMPDDPADAVALAATVAPDVLQLHADFDPEGFETLRAETGRKVVAAVDAADADRVRALDGAVDAVLLDSTTDEGAGGTGETHDWDAAADLVGDLATPVVLAGGLTPENVGRAVETVHPFAVDVAGGVEGPGGFKQADAVRSFVDEARRAGVVVER